jgi:hypothetical protein
MEQKRIKKVIFTSLLLTTILFFSFALLDTVNSNYSRNAIISNIDQTINESLISRNNEDAIILHGKFVGIMEAEFDQNSAKISVTDVEQ